MKKVLLVEDTLHLAEEISDLLRMAGYDVMFVKDGYSALGILKKFKPDLILTDLVMPGMDGAELIYQIRIREDYSHVPIVIFSAKAQEEDRYRGKLVGANEFISKPCKATELLSVINDLIGSRGRAKLALRVHPE
jgi:DNA-binding response OmpR family regulator